MYIIIVEGYRVSGERSTVGYLTMCVCVWGGGGRVIVCVCVCMGWKRERN